MALELSSAGITLGYCAETTAGTKPTTGYTNIPNIKSIPDFNVSPDTIEVTDLADTTYKRYITGLKDISGALAFEVNFTKAFATVWNALVSAYATAKASGKAIWFEINVPEFGKFYFAGEPTELGLPSVGVGDVFAGSVYITPNKVDGWTIA